MALELKCPFFQTMFNTALPMREVTDNSLTLPDDDANAWHACIEFIYLGTYNTNTVGSIHGESHHAKVYTLAHRLCMEKLKIVAYHNFYTIFHPCTECRKQIGYFYMEFNSNRLTRSQQSEFSKFVKVTELVYANTEDTENPQAAPTKTIPKGPVPIENDTGNSMPTPAKVVPLCTNKDPKKAKAKASASASDTGRFLATFLA